MSFEGRTAIVTGAAGGMGGQIAADLLAAGASVALFDLHAPRASLAEADGARVYTGDLADAGERSPYGYVWLLVKAKF